MMKQQKNFLSKWLEIIRNCQVSNTYKMAWARAITEIACDQDVAEDDLVEISLEQIAHEVVKLYWNQTIFFNLVQGSNPNMPPEVVNWTKELISAYQERVGNKQPTRFERVDINGVCPEEYRSCIKKVVRTLKADVSYRFVILNGKVAKGIYDYQKGAGSLVMSGKNLINLKRGSILVFEAINYRWSQILESYNTSPRICKKVRIIDEEKVRRKPLSGFSKYLDVENPGHSCFICGEEVSGNELAIDHVLPWSYLYSDDIWNLVYTHKGCNSSKSNIIPDEEAMKRLEERNISLLGLLEEKGKKDKIVAELRFAVENNLVRKFWISCQG